MKTSVEPELLRRLSSGKNMNRILLGITCAVALFADPAMAATFEKQAALTTLEVKAQVLADR